MNAVTDPTWFEKQAHVPTEEVERDIADTEREIASEKKCLEAYTILATYHEFEAQRALYVLKAANAEFANRERVTFVENLKALLEYRRGEGIAARFEAVMREGGTFPDGTARNN